MRAFALWVLIALVPLRLWAADAMALSTIAPHAPVTAATGADAGCEQHRSSVHESGALEPSAAGADVGDGASHADAGPSHAQTLCDVCNGPAIAAPSMPLALSAPADVAVDRLASRFASATLSRGLKPPIA
ncbi:MAG: hypothetical protein MUC32_02910 [Burkholderiaceae bacterium]|nr:hypothetical protein [Burkholderiaceae bacterium]